MKEIILSLFLLFLLSACASKNEINETKINKIQNSVHVDNENFDDEFEDNETEVYDPMSGYNRVMTSFNDKFFIYIVRPTAQGYAYVVPEPARIGISNFIENLLFPIRFVNNLLQLKFKNSLEELGRFTINSTIGLAGFIDVAKNEYHLDKHDEDFGQTLGFWGVGSGFHVVMPFLGPSNLRDIAGLSVDAYLDPTFSLEERKYRIPDNLEKSLGIVALRVVNKTSLHLGEYENLKKDAIDLYPFLRDIYEQKRDNEIKE